MAYVEKVLYRINFSNCMYSVLTEGLNKEKLAQIPKLCTFAI